MHKKTLNPDDIQAFVDWMKKKTTKSEHTIDSYRHGLLSIYKEMGSIDKQAVEKFRDTMVGKYSEKTVSIRIMAYNSYVKDYLKKPNLQVKNIKIQRAMFVDNVPTPLEVEALLEGLKADGYMRDYFLIKLLAQTGARVSEIIQFKLVDLQQGFARMLCKGRKVRTIFIPETTAAEALEYFKDKSHPESGHIFMTHLKAPISIRGVSSRLLFFAKKYGIRKEVCHPHAFRHYFAKQFLKQSGNNVVMLADLLGHGSVDTTAIYLRMSQSETKNKFNDMVNW